MDKRRLMDYRALQREIAELRQERERLEAGMLGAPVSDGMPRTGGGDPTGELAVTLAELDAMLTDRIRKAKSARMAIEEAIASLESRERRLLRLRYVDGRKWRQVAQMMGYSEVRVKQLHRKALQLLEKR